MSPVKTTTVTVKANTGNGKVIIVQEPEPGDAGEFLFQLEVTSVSGAKAKAFLCLIDHSKLKPDDGTLADSIQGVIFPFQDAYHNALTPTFNTQVTHGAVEVAFVVLMDGATAAQPWEAVVIVDW